MADFLQKYTTPVSRHCLYMPEFRVPSQNRNPSRTWYMMIHISVLFTLCCNSNGNKLRKALTKYLRNVKYRVLVNVQAAGSLPSAYRTH